MPFVSVIDTIKAAITFENTAANQAVNVLHFQDAAGGDKDTRLAALQGVMIGWLNPTWASVANEAWSAVSLDLRYLDTEDDAFLSDSLDIPGTLVGESLPSEVTVAISLRTPFTGRSRRGRLYHVGIGENNTEGDLISEGYRSNLIAAYAGLLADAQALDFSWSVVSYYANGAARAVPLVTPYTFVTITDRIVDSQRKRKPRA